MEQVSVAHIPPEVQRDVLVFDWWIRNMDRSLGNTNLLFNPTRKELVVIDHNLAFDPSFSKYEFLKTHLFAAQWQSIEDDLMTQAQYMERLSKAMTGLDEIWNNAPSEWRWENSEMDVPAKVDLALVKKILSRCEDADQLWKPV